MGVPSIAFLNFFEFTDKGLAKENPNNDERFFPWFVSLWLYSTMKSYKLLKNEKIVFTKFTRIHDFIEETASRERYFVRRFIKLNESFLSE
jgi:hypothetical protein